MSKNQLTLALLKPDIALNEKAVSAIRNVILHNQFMFVKSKFQKLTIDQTKKFYQAHESKYNSMFIFSNLAGIMKILTSKEKFFYNRLTYSMASGPIWSHILYHPTEAIANWRKIIGPTKVFKTIFERPESIRGQFGTTDTRNVCHGSDSIENAREEISFFFPEFDIDDWFKNKEPYFRNFQVVFDPKLVEHVPNLK